MNKFHIKDLFDTDIISNIIYGSLIFLLYEKLYFQYVID